MACTYDLKMLKQWKEKIYYAFNGGETSANVADVVSISDMIKDYTSIVEALVAPGVWEGPSAQLQLGNFNVVFARFDEFRKKLSNSFENTTSELFNSLASVLEGMSAGEFKVDLATIVEPKAMEDIAVKQAAHATDAQETYEVSVIEEKRQMILKMKTEGFDKFATSLSSVIKEFGSGNGMCDINGAESAASELATSCASVCAEAAEMIFKEIIEEMDKVISTYSGLSA